MTTTMTNPLPFDPAVEPYVSLATFRRSGVEVPTPVWIAATGGRYYVISTGEVGKVKRIRNNPRVRLAACDMRGKVRGEWIEGTAALVPELPSGVSQAMRAKYGLQVRMLDFFSRLFGKIDKRAYIEISLSA